MLSVERHREILNRIEAAGCVRVADLARELKVTEETIRRDLEKLGIEGKLQRIHGGALSLEEDRRETPYHIRKTANLKAKQAIAARAVTHLAEGDVIAIDASSTALEMARIIPDMPITVVTNSLVAVTAVKNHPRVDVVCTGGKLHVPSLSFIGTLAEKALERFNINKLFFSTKGVDLLRGLSVANDDHARLKRRMMELAEIRYLLADRSKFGVKSVEFFANLSDVDVVITDEEADRKMMSELTRLGLTGELAV